MKVFSSWSGGKECALATYEAISNGHEVCCLLNFISEDGQRSRSHGIKAEVLALQAKAVGIPIVQVRTSWEDYEENFKKAVRQLKSQGIGGGVFGDIEIPEHREWVERVCSQLGIEALLPLWGRKAEDLIDQLLRLKFRAIVVATRLEPDLLGKELDMSVIERISMLGSHVCGENGEYHTLVVAGPIFKNGLKISTGGREKREDMWFLEVSAELLQQDVK